MRVDHPHDDELDGAQDDAEDVHHLGTLLVLLYQDLQWMESQKNVLGD